MIQSLNACMKTYTCIKGASAATHAAVNPAHNYHKDATELSTATQMVTYSLTLSTDR